MAATPVTPSFYVMQAIAGPAELFFDAGEISKLDENGQKRHSVDGLTFPTGRADSYAQTCLLTRFASGRVIRTRLRVIL